MVAERLGDLPPPEREHLASIDREVPLSRGRYLRDRHHQYRGRITSFRLQLSADIAGQREVVAAIDTDEGEVRMHTFARGGVEEIEVIERIPPHAPATFIDNAYLAAYDHLISGADQLIDAWGGRRHRPLSADGI